MIIAKNYTAQIWLKIGVESKNRERWEQTKKTSPKNRQFKVEKASKFYFFLISFTVIIAYAFFLFWVKKKTVSIIPRIMDKKDQNKLN